MSVRFLRIAPLVGLVIALASFVFGVVTGRDQFAFTASVWVLVAAVWVVGVRLIVQPRRRYEIRPDVAVSGPLADVLGQLDDISGPARVEISVRLAKSASRPVYSLALEGDQALGHVADVLDPLQQLGWITASSHVEAAVFGLETEAKPEPRPSDDDLLARAFAAQGGAR